MRLLHTSDWHLGRRLHGADLLADQAIFLEWLLAVAQSERADAVLVSGDVYDRAQPGADAIGLLDRTVAAFARARIPLIISSGNHDSAVRLQYAGEVLADAGHPPAHLTGPGHGSGLLSEPTGGRLGVYAIPYLLPDAVVGELDVDRSHAAVLGRSCSASATDAAVRGTSIALSSWPTPS